MSYNPQATTRFVAESDAKLTVLRTSKLKKEVVSKILRAASKIKMDETNNFRKFESIESLGAKLQQFESVSPEADSSLSKTLGFENNRENFQMFTNYMNVSARKC